MSENRLALAASAVQSQELSQQRAASLYNVSWSSLDDHIIGCTNKKTADLKKYKLQVSEEAALIQWILSMNKCSLSSQHLIVQSMANLLLEKWRDGNSTTVEFNWVTCFIKQHENLKSKFIQKFNYKHSFCENSLIIQSWFQLVQEITEKYEILLKNIYNINEVGFT